MGLTAALAGLTVLNAGISGASPEPARQHIQLQKLCPRALMDPTFVIDNVTDDATLSTDSQTYAPENLLVTLRRGATGPVIMDLNGPGAADDVLLENIPIAAGQTLVVTAEGALWSGPVFAEFDAMYRGQVRSFSARMMCACEDTPPSSSSSSSSSTPTTEGPT